MCVKKQHIFTSYEPVHGIQYLHTKSITSQTMNFQKCKILCTKSSLKGFLLSLICYQFSMCWGISYQVIKLIHVLVCLLFIFPGIISELSTLVPTFSPKPSFSLRKRIMFWKLSQVQITRIQKLLKMHWRLYLKWCRMTNM